MADVDKVIDLNKTVFELSRDYPEMIEILDELGFHDIIKPGMLQTVGRFMTLPKGATMKKISLELIKHVLMEKGYKILE